MQQGEQRFGRGQFQIKVQPALKLFFKYSFFLKLYKIILGLQKHRLPLVWIVYCLYQALQIPSLKVCWLTIKSIQVILWIQFSMFGVLSKETFCAVTMNIFKCANTTFTQVLIELNKFIQNHCILIEQNVGVLFEARTNSN